MFAVKEKPEGGLPEHSGSGKEKSQARTARVPAESAPGDADSQGFSLDYKMWLEKDGAVFGDGLYKLLLNVGASGSISQAAREMGMSYRAAWGKIKQTERRWGVPLVVTRVGGELGGGAKLTPEAGDLLERYGRLRREFDDFARNSFREVFRGWPAR
ncbi:MAG: LysR family transcriptional regulator [Peptococcaceae bacterium]|nr:LysR family transcriptional regulator [Peptococcaceae bacterium]